MLTLHLLSPSFFFSCHYCQIFSARVRVDSTAKVSEIEAAERQKMKEKVDKILAHKMNCFINRQLIYNYPEQVRRRRASLVFVQVWAKAGPLLLSCLLPLTPFFRLPFQLFADAGVMAIEHADFEGVERLALVLGGEIVSTFDTPDQVGEIFA